MSFIKKLSDKLGRSQPKEETPKGINIAFSSFSGNNGGLNVLPPKPSEGSNFTILEHRLGKPGGGWADDDDNKQKSQTTTSNGSQIRKESNGNGNGNNSNGLMEAEDLEDKNIEYEMKIISDIIQPGGARIKPSNTVLQEFTANCQNLQVNLMASVLMYVLETEIPANSKAKAFYAVDFLVHSNPKYQKIFEDAIPRLIEVPDDQQFKTIKGNLIKFLQDPTNFHIQKEDKVAEALSKNVVKDSESNDLLALGEKKKKGFGFIGKKDSDPTIETKAKGFNFIKAEKKVEPPTFDLLSHVMSEPERKTDPQPIQPQPIQPQPVQNPYDSLYSQGNPHSTNVNLIYPQNQNQNQGNIYGYNIQASNSLAQPVEEKKEKDPKEAVFDFISF